MNTILSQEEIEALLSNVEQTSDIEDINIGADRQFHVYDWKHPDRISKDQIRSLRTIHENFSRLLATYLSTVLRAMVDVNLLSIDQVTYSEYTMSLTTPASIYVMSSENLEGKIIMELSPALLLFLVDRLLGGGGETMINPREITLIEQNVVRGIINNMIGILNEVWGQAVDLNCKYSSFETDPQFVQIARSSDTIAVIFIEVKVKNSSYQMNICVPYYMLEPFLPKLSSQAVIGTTKKISEEDRLLLRQTLQASKLQVAAQLAKARLSIREFIDLKRDDVIKLVTTTDQELPVLVGDKIKFTGFPGKSGRFRAIRITRTVSPLEELFHK
jgi:flagellar motor switch protein FliM